MQNNNKHYRYTLEHCSGNNRKKPCPACGQMTFARYIDTETGEYLADDVGRCGYHTGHRVKSPQSRVSWVHHQPQFTDFHLRQCLFGLHLLTPDTGTVCIVEAEKTAVIASIFFPDTLFLATGGITNLRPETCEPLKGRNIILFPDLGAEDNWAEKAKNIPALRGCHLSTWLSRHSTPEMRSAGLDLADVLEDWNPGEKLRIEDFL